MLVNILNLVIISLSSKTNFYGSFNHYEEYSCNQSFLFLIKDISIPVPQKKVFLMKTLHKEELIPPGKQNGNMACNCI